MTTAKNKMLANENAVKASASELASALGVELAESELVAGRAIKHAERLLREWRQHLLLDLANVSVEAPRLQRLMQSFDPETPQAIAAAQVALRSIWRRDLSLPKKQFFADLFLRAAQRANRAGILAPLPMGYLMFAARNFPGQVVVAVLENWWQMAASQNPDCPARYFLAKRSTQKYCERGECTRYAVRKKANKWWAQNRAKEKTKKRRTA